MGSREIGITVMHHAVRVERGAGSRYALFERCDLKELRDRDVEILRFGIVFGRC